jgi:hypothetical protein
MRYSNRTLIDLDALASLFRHGVAGVAELVHIGVTTKIVQGRCLPGGPWQRLLPGILLLGKAPPSRTQLVQAALRYARPDAILTGLDALRLHGMNSLPSNGPVHVLVPHQVSGAPGVRAERTHRQPNPVLRQGFLVAPLARAAMDTARRLKTDADVRAVFTEVVRRGGVTLRALHEELEESGTRGSALPRQVLDELSTATAVIEQRARELVRRAGLPQPRWNVPIRSADGPPLGVADAWWDDTGFAWKLGPTGAEELAAAGVVVLRTESGRLHREPDQVAEDLRRSYRLSRSRPRPLVCGERPMVTEKSTRPGRRLVVGKGVPVVNT